MLRTVSEDLQQFITILVHTNVSTSLQKETTTTKYNPHLFSVKYNYTEQFLNTYV
jgi:hypothetical protein